MAASTSPTLAGRDLHGRTLRGLDWSGRDLKGADLSGADLSETLLTGADLTGVNLTNANLQQADLRNAVLDDADLTGAQLAHANLGNAHMHRVHAPGACFNDATLSYADVRDANLQAASFADARLLHTKFVDVDAHSADFSHAELTACELQGSAFDDACFAGTRMRDLRDYAGTTWMACDISTTDFSHAAMLRRHILDENFIREIEERGKWARFGVAFWRVTSDCGRSFVRWGLWTFLITCLYALAYTQLPISFGPHETPLSPLYFSVVTITSLGYGDALPTNMASQLVVMSESILGFCMLGGLITLLSNKMARRAD